MKNTLGHLRLITWVTHLRLVKYWDEISISINDLIKEMMENDFKEAKEKLIKKVIIN